MLAKVFVVLVEQDCSAFYVLDTGQLLDELYNILNI